MIKGQLAFGWMEFRDTNYKLARFGKRRVEEREPNNTARRTNDLQKDHCGPIIVSDSTNTKQSS